MDVHPKRVGISVLITWMFSSGLFGCTGDLPGSTTALFLVILGESKVQFFCIVPSGYD
jgi:hypothetical protein